MRGVDCTSSFRSFNNARSSSIWGRRWQFDFSQVERSSGRVTVENLSPGRATWSGSFFAPLEALSADGLDSGRFTKYTRARIAENATSSGRAPRRSYRLTGLITGAVFFFLFGLRLLLGTRWGGEVVAWIFGLVAVAGLVLAVIAATHK